MTTVISLQPRLLNINQTREYLGDISRSHLYVGIEEGRYPKPIQDGGRSVWLREELDAALDRLAAQPRALRPRNSAKREVEA